MRILISSDTYYPHVNGASYFTQRLALLLTKAGHEVAVLAPSESFSNTDEIRNGVHVFGVRSLSILFYPLFRFVIPGASHRRIRRVLKAFKPDVVHIQMHFTICRAVAAQARRLNIPVIATNHFMPDNIVYYLPIPTFTQSFVAKLMWADCARILRKIPTVTSPTETAAKLLEPWLRRPVLAISCGIDRELFNPHVSKGDIMKKYSLPELPILLSVSRLDREKNIDLVLRAAANALKAVSFHLVIAGNGAEKNNLMRLAEKLGISRQVTFPGFVPNEELPSLYKVASCFVTASTAELQGITVMEAMATGLPIIGARAVALPELVHDGVNGLVFEPGDQMRLGEHLTTIFNDTSLRERMGAKSLEIISKHDINLTLKAFEDLYRKALKIG
jgi:glycosyltransferase involved in cell wall biosynthesis